MRREMRRRQSRPRRLPARSQLLVGGAVVSLALVAAGCGAQQSPAIPLFGPFAGYSWYGSVHEVSAVMIVPQIKDCPDHGAAGTWIGAEGHINPDTQVAPFFQVGVNEECTAPQNSYYAFWSSTAERFRPLWLLSVDPGDVVQLSMHANGDQWVMSARDETSNAQQTRAVNVAGQPPLDLASWHQEDVTDRDTSDPFPYPRLGVVRFSALRINNRPPRAKALTTIWMSTAHAILGPSHLISDAFSIGIIRPSAAALHYQRQAVREDFAADLFDTRLQSWTATSPSGAIKAGAISFARAMQESITSLRTYRWSANVRPAIDRLLDASERLRSLLLHDASSSGLSVKELRAVIRGNTVGSAGLVVRERLHMGITDESLITFADYIKAHPG
jgi:hypothetical protein